MERIIETNSNSIYGRRLRLWPIKIGVEPTFFCHIRKIFSFSRQQRRLFSLVVWKTKLKGFVKIISLREFGKCSNLAMRTTTFLIKRLLFLTKTKKSRLYSACWSTATTFLFLLSTKECVRQHGRAVHAFKNRFFTRAGTVKWCLGSVDRYLFFSLIIHHTSDFIYETTVA